MSNTRLYWLHALSPTHAGIGRGVGYVDLPIDRDGVTGWPLIRGSSFKGVWADYYRATKEAREENPTLKAAFGIADDNGASNAGALIPSDAKLVCLPVRSFRGTFAWCTSPLCLQLLRRTLDLANFKGLPKAPADLPQTDARLVARHVVDGRGPSALVESDSKRIYLEDLDFAAQPCEVTSNWAKLLAGWVFPDDTAWQTEFQKRFVVVPNDSFDFLCETGTEIHTRVKIHPEKKIVADGALWTEESLPAESILSGIVQCDRVFGRHGEEITASGLLDRFAKEPLKLQIGGKATVGRGQMRCVFTPVDSVAPVAGGIQ